jgi:hypothetical protein
MKRLLVGEAAAHASLCASVLCMRRVDAPDASAVSCARGGDLPLRRPLARLTALKMMMMPFICSCRNIRSTVQACQRPGRLAYIIISGLGMGRGWKGLVACRGIQCQYGS